MRNAWVVSGLIGLAAGWAGAAEAVLPKVNDPLLAGTYDQRIEDLGTDTATADKIRQELKGLAEALEAWDKANGKQVASLKQDLAKAVRGNQQAEAEGLRGQLWALIAQRDLLAQEKQEGLLGLLTADQQEYWLTQDMYASTLAGALLTGAPATRSVKVKAMSMATAGAHEVVVLNKRTDKAKARDRYNGKRTDEFQERERKRQEEKKKKEEERKKKEEEKKKKEEKTEPDPLAPLVPPTKA